MRQLGAAGPDRPRQNRYRAGEASIRSSEEQVDRATTRPTGEGWS